MNINENPKNKTDINNINIIQSNDDKNNYNNIIDERINKICEDAEMEYSQSQKKSNNRDNNNQIMENGISSINNQNNINNNNDNNNINRKNNNHLINKVNNEDIQKINNVNQSYSNIARINNKSLDTDVNILSKIKFGLENNNKKKLYNNDINSPFHKDSDNYNKKIILYNLNQKECIKDTNNKNDKIKTDLSKILLESRDLIKKLRIKQAYILLKKTISTGVKHSDLFYLYGEVNRLIKQYKTAEDYLLKALKFELHSPYVFYSLGILYQELKEYQNSNKFFKLFYRLMNSDDLHFQMGINYYYMKDYVNAAEELSKAIELNSECAEYYQFRSEIYKNMGLKEMENEDFRMYWFIVQKKREEE